MAPPWVAACLLAQGLATAAAVRLAQSRPGAQSQAYFWPGKNGNLQRTGGSSFRLRVNLSQGPAWSWHERGNGLVRAAPLIDGNRDIYLSSIAGGVYKFSPDGQLLWEHHAPHSIPEVPALMDGALYAATDAGMVFALDMETGKLRWSSRAGAKTAADTWSMTAGEGVVIAAVSAFGTANERIVALDGRNGSTLWSFKPQAPVYNFLSAVKDGSLVFSDLAGNAYRLNLADGQVIWQAPPGYDAALNAPDFTTGGAVIGPNNVVYVTSNAKENKILKNPKKAGYVTAFKFKDGTMLWRKSTEYEANNAAAVGKLGRGTPLAVVIGVGENPSMVNPFLQLMNKTSTQVKKSRILALDAQTGLELWRHELPDWHGWAAGDSLRHICLPDSFGNPAISGDGTVYVGSQSGAFYAVKDQNQDGQIGPDEVSTFNTSNAFQGSPGLAPGMVVATPCNGMHVFKTSEQPNGIVRTPIFAKRFGEHRAP